MSEKVKFEQRDSLKEKPEGNLDSVNTLQIIC